MKAYQLKLIILMFIFSTHFFNGVVMAQNEFSQIRKKVYFDQNHIYDIVYLKTSEIDQFKRQFGARLNYILDYDRERYEIYDLSDGNLLIVDKYNDPCLCSLEYWQTSESQYTTYPHILDFGVSQNVPSKTDSLIQNLADFMEVDIKLLDRSFESLRIVGAHFEKYQKSIGLTFDFDETLTAYFGEVMIRNYPNAIWEIEEKRGALVEILYYPYIDVNGHRIDFFDSIGDTLGNSDANTTISTLANWTINEWNRYMRK